jgi:sugar lactone lactonase YvrE
MKRKTLLLCVIVAGSVRSWGQAALKPVVKPAPANAAAKPATSTNAIVSPRSLTAVQKQVILKNPPTMAPGAAHSVTGVIPAEGTRGTVITISGEHFGNSTSDIVVKVNGVAAIVTGTSDNQILAIVPDKAGTGPISVGVKGKWASGAGFIYDWNAAMTFVAGVSANAQGFADGTGSAVKFFHPTGLARDAQGYIYIADCENNRIRRMNNFGQVTTIAGNGAQGAANGMGTAATFHYPQSLAVDAAGNIYVADDGNHLIRKITPAGMVTTLAGNATQRAVDGTGAAAGFSSLRGGTCVDASNNVYVGDGGTVRKITPAGVVTTLARGFNLIAAMICRNNVLYVADGNTISKVSLTGSVYPVAGNKKINTYVDGYADAAGFTNIVGMAMDASGVIFVTEENPDDYPPVHLRRVNTDGFVQTVGGVGLGTGILAGSVGDATNTFYQADRTFNCIRKVTIQ